MNTDDGDCFHRGSAAVSPENITRVHKLVLEDRKVRLRRIADTLNISVGSAFLILRKHCLNAVPRLVTVDNYM